MRRITPENIISLSVNEVFVFGSNLQGNHRSGAAKTALDKFGAKLGNGIGLQGRSYAIPTMFGNIEQIKLYVDSFILYAGHHPNLIFLVTKVGCGIAGYKAQDIAPFFENCLKFSNIALPLEFWKIIDNIVRKRKYRHCEETSQFSLTTSCDFTGVKTSYYPHFSIDAQLKGDILAISSGFSNSHIALCTIIKDEWGLEIYKDYIDSNSHYIQKLPLLKNGKYNVELYFQKERKGLYSRQLIIPIESTDKTFRFLQAPFSAHNKAFVDSLPKDANYLKTKTKLTAVVPGALTEFRNLAIKLTKYVDGEYNRLLSIHDWVAKNIFYDYDSLYNGNYKNTPIEKTAIVALRSRKCVCQGYTDLSVALLRSIGISSMGICCWAVDGEDNPNPFHSNKSNHIFTAAFCDDRWVFSDITWNSKNRYEKEAFDEDRKLSHTYFDATVDFLSYTHKMIEIQS